jgi:hypothetical protein
MNIQRVIEFTILMIAILPLPVIALSNIVDFINRKIKERKINSQ